MERHHPLGIPKGDAFVAKRRKNSLSPQFQPSSQPLALTSANAESHSFSRAGSDPARDFSPQFSSFSTSLCITSKYLSVVVRTEIGKTPSAWIKDMLIRQIRYYLLETNLTIKEICHKLHFENPSFFGKFTKQHLGCSPLEFRNGRNDARTPEKQAMVKHAPDLGVKFF